MNNKIKSGIRGDQLDEMGYKEICCKDGFLKMAREVDNQIEVVILSRRNGNHQERYNVENHYNEDKILSGQSVSMGKVEKLGIKTPFPRKSFSTTLSGENIDQSYKFSLNGERGYLIKGFSFS